MLPLGVPKEGAGGLASECLGLITWDSDAHPLGLIFTHLASIPQIEYESDMSASLLQRSLKHLQWPEFIDLTRGYACCEPAKNLLEEFRVGEGLAADLEAAQLLQAESAEAAQLLDKNSLWETLRDLEDPSQMLNDLSRSSVLSIESLVLLRAWLYACESWYDVPKGDLPGDQSKRAVSQLMDPHQPLKILHKILTPDGELSEKASPELQRISKSLDKAKSTRDKKAAQILDSYHSSGVLQDKYSDLRDGRMVLPIKASSQGNIDGSVYDTSVSKQTVYVEPAELRVLNNEICQLENDRQLEIFRILSKASKELFVFVEEMRSSFEILSYWDAVHAKARIAQKYGGKKILVTELGAISIRESAHPLLWFSHSSEEIMKNNIHFGEKGRALVITGPNTGGKTVLLKTLGLAALCARSGFLFPAIESPKVPFFENLAVDVGDPQSIEDHLSSFSGHILTMKEILENLNSTTLVLIDELNSATDPKEGAALARAFLEKVLDSSGAMICVTTHDLLLKALAVTNSQIVNASMEFDDETDLPTYKLLIGVPGSSRALDTARRLGLPQEIIQKARQHLSDQDRSFEDLISSLKRKLREAQWEKKLMTDQRARLDQEQRKWKEKTSRSVAEVVESMRRKLKRSLAQAQDEVKASVKKLRESGGYRGEVRERKNLSDVKSRFQSSIDSALGEELPELADSVRNFANADEESEPPKPENLNVGASVRVLKWNQIGKVVEKSDESLIVALGNMKLTLSYLDVRTVNEKEVPKKSAKRTNIEFESESASESLDVRGMRLEDAIREMEQYLDRAYRSGRPSVKLIHGLGTGALREGARKLLSELPYVSEFKDAAPSQGGAGATLVTF